MFMEEVGLVLNFKKVFVNVWVVVLLIVFWMFGWLRIIVVMLFFCFVRMVFVCVISVFLLLLVL